MKKIGIILLVIIVMIGIAVDVMAQDQHIFQIMHTSYYSEFTLKTLKI